MTIHLSRSDYERIAVAIIDGATVEDAASLVHVTGRTIERRMKADPTVGALIKDAIAEREASRERVGHGTATRYSHGCHCQPCRDANAQAKRRLRRSRIGQPIPAHVEHGRHSTYRDWNCRCQPCTRASSEYNAPYVRAYGTRQRRAAS